MSSLPTVSPSVTSPASLAEALCQAQSSCKAVAHDSHNEYKNFDYASAESIIAEGKKALSEQGLALIPMRCIVSDQGDRLTRHFELRGCGESIELCTVWPIVVGNGWPLDKAMAAIATTSLAYTLRDLLLMPRVDKRDDIAGRDDRQHSKPAKPIPVPKAEPIQKPEPVRRITDEDCDAIGRMIRLSGANVERFLANYNVKAIKQLSPEQAADAIGLLERKLDAAARSATGNGQAIAKS